MKRIISVIRKVCGDFYKLLCHLRLFKPTIIVMVDGGLCSQMHQYLQGMMLKSKGNDVEYDLSFYDTGLDLDGNPTRKFLLKKIFPQLDFIPASKVKTMFYKQCFNHSGQHPKSYDISWLDAKAPIYLSGYYSDVNELFCFGGGFSKFFVPNLYVLSSSKLNILNKVTQSNSIGLHIRRGDLKTYNVVYGNPVTVDYIITAVDIFKQKFTNPYFFFFSDDFEYVKNEVMPKLGLSNNYWISDSNQDTVYEDFILLSYCKGLITSKGTMGKYAALYDNAEVVILSSDDKQKNILDNLKGKVVIL